ncbi:UDP-3-O-acyl-N-acetylglucosamine deacetylase [Cyanobacterium sp. uoEpiScrs1]|uniref:UDP-3-O-acyl-N-acetylglucosamine deacetylase n=1 Tax=Cyanobacterium sp. uoEpiScrs1 TaxID=2976343 RepID=UPI00226A6D76|nr:UDP-3-O-acyl-N-acetylglucosamine deacetylase [Cyanobacterium sp. uoEpiScrs1]
MSSTLREIVTVSGIGLHSGVETQVSILPAQSGEGRYFVRVDLPGNPIIPAEVASVSETTLSTKLSRGNVAIRTVEHLLSTLIAIGVKDARIEVDGTEIPLLDGSAQEWLKAIICGGVTPSSWSTNSTLLEPIWVRDGDAFVAAIPAFETRFTYGIDFPYPAIGNQWHSWNPNIDSFEKDIAPARTFGFADQIEKLQKMGLIQGGSLKNALVCDHEKWLNLPLRFENEPARHKLLDLIGDLSLLGTIPQGHFLAYKASHKLHIQLAMAIKKKLNT